MTLYHYVGGTGTNVLGKLGDEVFNRVIAFETESHRRDYVDYDFPSGRERAQADYYYWEDTFLGAQIVSETTNLYSKGDFPFTFSQLKNGDVGESATRTLMSADDIVDGSSEGGSLHGWTHDGDDLIRLHTGNDNYIEAGFGKDYIQNWTWHADGIYKGGAGNDRFSVADGDIYGESGADTFQIVPVYTDVNGINGPGIDEGSSVYANIVDFEVGVDRVVGSGLPILSEVRTEGIWLGAEGARWSMFIEGVYDVSQLNLTTT